MATSAGGQSSLLPSHPKDPVKSPSDCPHCESLCLGPTILPCGHVLCRRCLRDLLQLMEAGCPRCQHPLRLPKDKALNVCQLIQQMSTDPVLDHLVFQKLERERDVRCLNCPNKKAANVCLDCQDHYCEACSAIHLRGRNGRDHVLRLLPQALRNVSFTASTSSRPPTKPRSPTSIVDSIRNMEGLKSRGVSHGDKEWKEWMEKEVGLLQQACSDYQEVKVVLEKIVSAGELLGNQVDSHHQLLLAYQQYLPDLEVVVTPSADPGSSAREVKVRGSEVSVDMKTECLKRRVQYGVRENYRCPDIDTLKMIMAQLSRVLHSADEEENSGSEESAPAPSTSTHSSPAAPPRPQIPPTHNDTPAFEDLMTATPQRVFKAPTRSPQDKKSPWISAIACLSDERLVLTDTSNNKVKVMNLRPPHILSASTDIPEKPADLAVLPDGLVATTTANPLIYLITVTNTMMVASLIKTVRQYVGIAGHSEGLLIASCARSSEGPAAVDVVTRQGGLVRTLTDDSVQLMSPWFLCHSGDQHILLSDWGLDLVHQIDVISGQVTQTFRHEHMKKPLQVCADSDGNVFVACGVTDCVMVRSKDGQWKRLLTGSQHSDPKKTVPCGVCLTRSGHLMVSWEGPLSDPDSSVICYEFR